MQWHSMVLNKRSPIPLYYQLAELIKERIRSGELKLGDQLPSERDLSEHVAVSRMTARQAIAYLVREGTLVVKPGVGTFVAEPKLIYNALHLLGFTEETIRRGGLAASQVLEQAVVTPPLRVASWLNLKPGEQAVKVVRLRLSGATPLLLETSFVPTALCPGLEHADLAAQSLYALLEQHYRLHLEHARQTLEASVANDYEAALFGIKPGTSMILVEGATYLNQGSPVEYFKAIYRGDRVKFEFESQRNNVAEALITPRLNLVLL